MPDIQTRLVLPMMTMTTSVNQSMTSRIVQRPELSRSFVHTTLYIIRGDYDDDDDDDDDVQYGSTLRTSRERNYEGGKFTSRIEVKLQDGKKRRNYKVGRTNARVFLIVQRGKPSSPLDNDVNTTIVVPAGRYTRSCKWFLRVSNCMDRRVVSIWKTIVDYRKRNGFGRKDVRGAIGAVVHCLFNSKIVNFELEGDISILAMADFSGDSCYYCIIVNDRHENVIQFREGWCSPEQISLDEMCSNIKSDDTLYSMFRVNSKPIPCPFSGASFTFTYDKGFGECATPISLGEKCTDESKLLLKYQACPDIERSESNSK
ncbi:unnamed protein product [Heterotrigona itama]|uniref:Uncharacterized protein n=1 Tax=Heterotrigona itama TaxID=395501 RepID=A0A6V7H0E8_9HYME|nr:unnamed protein product [Heterotrigona itama]